MKNLTIDSLRKEGGRLEQLIWREKLSSRRLFQGDT
jgi:hypothetical protein